MHKLLVRGGKLLVAIAAAWAVGASLYIFSLPVTMHGVTDFMMPNSGPVVETLITERSWYAAHGLSGTFWLVFFSGFYLAATRAAWTGNHIGLVIISVVAVVLSVVTGFSIGGVYLPAALGLLIGSFMFISSKLVRARC